jgi:hypothetical protein
VSNDNGGNSKSSNAETAWSLERTAAHLEKLQRQQEKLRKRNFGMAGASAGAAGGGCGGTALSMDTAASAAAAAAAAAASINIPDPLSEERERLYQLYLQQAATELKRLLSARDLPTKGRKPDLARRLARDDLETQYGWTDPGKPDDDSASLLDSDEDLMSTTATTKALPTVSSFGALTRLSSAASMALTRAQFTQPFAIQSAALAWIVQRQSSCILHAATGSGTNKLSQCIGF